MIARARVTQATLARFRDRPLAYGSADCVRLAAFHLRGMGHRVSLAKAGAYDSFRGALRAIRQAGHPDLMTAVRAQGLLEIPPAATLAGDLLALQGAGPDGEPVEGFPALMIAAGNGRAIGFLTAPDGVVRCGVVQPLEYVTAWRVEPRGAALTRARA
jgi:hypothetical protein